MVRNMLWETLLLIIIIPLIALPGATSAEVARSYAGGLTPTASFVGTHFGERVGYALSGGGDVNGDGIDDLLIGTFHHKTYGADGGAAYLVLGNQATSMGMSLTGAAARFQGESQYQAVGYGVANNGDVNGDGYADMLIGAPAGNSKVHLPGKMYIVFGNPNLGYGSDFMLWNQADAAITGEQNWDRCGVSVAYVGDINNDGFDDFICGAPDNDLGGESAGKVYLFLGKAAGWHLGLYSASEAVASFYVNIAQAYLGFSVAGAGDVNGDGIPDFIMGAPGINRAFVMYGRQDVGYGRNVNLFTSADAILSGSYTNNEEIGYSVSGAGDVNGDGVDDLIIGAKRSRDAAGFAGKVYIQLGQFGGWSGQAPRLDLEAGSFLGESGGDQAGWSVAGVGDVNGDGLSDCLVGMFNEKDKKNVSGKGYLLPGHESPWQPGVSLETSSFFELQKYTLTGFCVAAAGDLNGDDWGDYLVASPYSGTDSCGQVFVFKSERPHFYIGGRVTYGWTSAGMCQTQVNLSGDYNYTTTTDNGGNFLFDAWGRADYTLEIEKSTQLPLTDGTITAMDAALIARNALGLVSLTELQQDVADVNQNENVDIYDATLILKYLVGEALPGGAAVGEWTLSPERVLFSDLQGHSLNQNIQAVVCGDVDGSWGTALSMTNSAKDPVQRFCKTGTENNKFELILDYAADAPLLAFEATIIFEPTAVKFLQSQLSEEFASEFIHVNQEPGKWQVAGFLPEAASKQGRIGAFQFQRLRETEAKITVTNFRINGELLPDQEYLLKKESSAGQIKEFALEQNFPNPFNLTTCIRYALPLAADVEMKIYNAVGQKVSDLMTSFQEAGRHEMFWNGTDSNGQVVPTGVYFVKIKAGDFQGLRKMILLK